MYLKFLCEPLDLSVLQGEVSSFVLSDGEFCVKSQGSQWPLQQQYSAYLAKPQRVFSTLFRIQLGVLFVYVPDL